MVNRLIPMKLGCETSSSRIARGNEGSGTLQKGRWRAGREKEWWHPRRAQDYFMEEEARTFNWNRNVEAETGKPIYAPDHKGQENNF
jgi:hypothetical protein